MQDKNKLMPEIACLEVKKMIGQSKYCLDSSHNTNNVQIFCFNSQNL